jgi:hypothetical protein
MRGIRGLVAVALVVGAVIALGCWTGVGRTADAEKPAEKTPDRLEVIEKKLVRMEQVLLQIQDQLKELKAQKTGWQRINDPKVESPIIMMNVETGKIKFIYTSTGQVIEK